MYGLSHSEMTLHGNVVSHCLTHTCRLSWYQSACPIKIERSSFLLSCYVQYRVILIARNICPELRNTFHERFVFGNSTSMEHFYRCISSESAVVSWWYAVSSSIASSKFGWEQSKIPIGYELWLKCLYRKEPRDPGFVKASGINVYFRWMVFALTISHVGATSGLFY